MLWDLGSTLQTWDSSMVFIMSWTLQLQQIAFVMWLKVLIKARSCSPIIIRKVDY